MRVKYYLSYFENKMILLEEKRWQRAINRATGLL